MIKIRTLADRFREAYRSFRGKEIGSIQYGLKVKRCDECEYKNPPPAPSYWMNVKDQLPPERGRYMCYFRYEPETPDVVGDNYYHGGGRWLSESSKVTHWANMPELPEFKEEPDVSL